MQITEPKTDYQGYTSGTGVAKMHRQCSCNLKMRKGYLKYQGENGQV